MHIFRHKFISILFALGQKKMSLKSDQLEVSGSVCIKCFEIASMTILSPETVCQCSIMDIQVPSVPNQPKTAEILAQSASKMH